MLLMFSMGGMAVLCHSMANRATGRRRPTPPTGRRRETNSEVTQGTTWGGNRTHTPLWEGANFKSGRCHTLTARASRTCHKSRTIGYSYSRVPSELYLVDGLR